MGTVLFYGNRLCIGCDVACTNADLEFSHGYEPETCVIVCHECCRKYGDNGGHAAYADCGSPILIASSCIVASEIRDLRKQGKLGTRAPNCSRSEKPCRCCSRMNDVGVKTCWLCGNAPH